MNQTIARARGRAFTMVVAGACLLLPVLAQAQTITTIAGNGTPGSSGDGGPATSASTSPFGVAVDAAGNSYIADSNDYRIRKVTPGGIISTVAGTGTNGFSGDGGPATSARISYVARIALDAAGNLYLADRFNNRVRMVTPGGMISTIAGNGSPGYGGDGGAATSALIDEPFAITVDGAGNIIFSEWGNNRIRKITPAGVISTIAGNGSSGFSGDGGPATNASLFYPIGVGADGGGNLYFADQTNRIRKVTPVGVISTIVGNGSAGFSGDGGPAAAATVSNPWDVKADSAGNVYIADKGNARIRKVTPTGMISTFAGSGPKGFSGDGGPAADARLNTPLGLAIAAASVLIADYGNSRIRMVAKQFTTCAAEGYTGSRLTLCRQVCEIDQTPTRLLSLIRLYRTAYREDPPCGQ